MTSSPSKILKFHLFKEPKLASYKDLLCQFAIIDLLIFRSFLILYAKFIVQTQRHTIWLLGQGESDLPGYKVTSQEEAWTLRCWKGRLSETEGDDDGDDEADDDDDDEDDNAAAAGDDDCR